MAVHNPLPRRALIVVVTGLVAVAAPEISAQETVEVSDEQRTLNDEGVTAISEGEYDDAIELFESSIEYGELNVTYANLGRAHQHAGRCQQAERYFEEALEAPRAENPPPQAVEDAIEGYRREMSENCPGYLDVDCEPEDIELSIDGQGLEQCLQVQRELLPGNYAIRGEYEGHVTETTVGIQALETSHVQLTVSEAEVDEPTDDGIGDVERPPEPTFGGPGWAYLAGGGAALAGAIALDTVPESSRNGEINAINFVPVALYGASIGLSYIGIRNLRR